MKKILLTPLLFLCFKAIAQMPVLVHEFVSGANGGYPGSFCEFNSKLYFSAADNNADRELWSIDLSGNVTLVANINPFGSGMQALNGQMIVFNNKLYLSADNDVAGQELMVYDGTNAPTVAADIYPGLVSSTPAAFSISGNTLYFTADVTGSGRELYTYDGTSAPSIVELVPGSVGGGPGNLTPLNGKLYFSAQTTAEGRELFVYDPGTNMISLVSDIEAGATGSSPKSLTLLNNKIYFYCTTSTYGTELYSYDGTNVVRLTDIAPGAGNGVDTNPGSAIAVYNGQLYFRGSASGTDYELWKYDPATGNASLVYDIYPAGNSQIRSFIGYAGKLYFVAVDATNGQELWMHDGSNTQLAADINPGSGPSFIGDLAIFNNKLYMSATNGATGNELYSFSDPTNIKNVELKGDVSIVPNPTSSDAVLHLSLKEDVRMSVTVTDVAGKTAWESSAQQYTIGDHQINIPLSRTMTGIYFYRLISSDGALMATGKIQRQ